MTQTPSISQIVGNLKTPQEYIDKDDRGIEYPKPEYMRYIADQYYPGWSWTILSYDFTRNPATELPVAITVHGRLEWHEEGLTVTDGVHHKRTGDMIASHRVQHMKNDPDKLLDLGNDVKAANTDCIKKAWNLYMHICDDIYRWESPTLTIKQYRYMENLLKKFDDSESRLEVLNTTLDINKKNFSQILQGVKLELDEVRTKTKSK
jgi:hypothetical protein